MGYDMYILGYYISLYRKNTYPKLWYTIGYDIHGY